MQNRSQEIFKASLIGIIGNSILAVAKIVIGLISGSFAVLAHGIDSLMDVGTNILTMVTGKIIQRPPDQSFPYGYRRAETIATSVLSFVIFFVGAELLINSIRELGDYSTHGVPQKIALAVTALSIVGKVILGFFQLKIGKKIDSKMLIASAKNMFNDLYVSITILIGLLITYYFSLAIIDLVLAVIVSIWIMKTGVEIFLDSNTELMDGMNDNDMYKKIIDSANEIEGVFNPHRIRIRRHANMFVVVMDIEVSPSTSVLDAHNLVVEIENKIKLKIDNIYDIMIHVEPLGNHEDEESENYGLDENKLK